MKKAILFLEPKGTILEVIRTAKAQGYQVLALMTNPEILDALPSPYDTARSCIDKVLTIQSWQDTAGVLSVVKEIQKEWTVAGVYFGTDACALIGSILREYLALPGTSPNAMADVLNKRKMRLRLKETGLSKIKSHSKEEVETWTTWPLTGSAYFKPVYGSFSLYVKRCQSLDDLKAAQGQWKTSHGISVKYMADYMSQSADYHLEEAFNGELLSVEAISANGKFQVIGLTSRILYSKDASVEMGSCFPYPHALSEKITETVKRAHLALGFTDGPSHTEVIVNSKGEVEIIDFNPRFVGADVLQSINLAYGIKIEEALLAWALGKEVTIKSKTSLFSCLQYVLSPEPLCFESITFPKAPEVKFTASFIKPGTDLADIHRQIDYLGTYLTVMPSFNRALERSKELRSQIKINGVLEGGY